MFFKRYQTIWVGQSILLSQLPWIQHGISTRKGGMSDPPFSSLNLATNVDDDEQSVQTNRHIFFQSIGFSEGMICQANQVHGRHIACVTEPGTYQSTDGFMSVQSDLLLTIRTADCVPVFIVDINKRAVGLVHAGWRGTVSAIAKTAVEQMSSQFQSSREDLLVWIGPSIGPCCYEVGDEVEQTADHRYIHNSRLNLWMYNSDQLLEAGIQKKHIEISRICTVCYNDWFYSYRGSNGQTGRMISYLRIKEKGLS